MSAVSWRNAILLPVAWLMATAAAAQDKPDFSGQWVRTSPPNPADDAPQQVTIRHSAKGPAGDGGTLAIDRRFKQGVLNGAASTTRFSVIWEGKALVMETGGYSGPGYSGSFTAHREIWLLASCPTTSVLIANWL